MVKLAVRLRQNPCIICAFKSPTRNLSTSTPSSARVHPVTSRYRKRVGLHKQDNWNRTAESQQAQDGPSYYRPLRSHLKSHQRSPDKLVFAARRSEVRFKPGAGGSFAWPRRQHRTKQESDRAIKERFLGLQPRLHDEAIFARLALEPAELAQHCEEFRRWLFAGLEGNDQTENYVLSRLRNSALSQAEAAIDLELKYALFGHIITSRFSNTDLRHQAALANLSYPSEWFPATRRFQREFHLHVGPTNSGKTYHALKRLEEAETGLYAGPLRLLAHEVYMRLNSRGLRCNLMTGDEQRVGDETMPEAPMISCTVEMVPLSTKIDVAVIDEIQMLGSEDRGWAWTQAVLGVQAREVHLCGEERSVPILKEIAAMCGEKLHIHRYERLSPLKMAGSSLEGDFKKLRKGDCVVAFSIVEIHSLRQIIEKTLNKRVAIIYGSLPPETRAQQARLFNDPDNEYDILVASNAVGMGLNLSIKRMVFQSSIRFNGLSFINLSTAEVKQIAGRAGRYSTAEEDMKQGKDEGEITFADTAKSTPRMLASPSRPVGLVTTLEENDYANIASAMTSDPEPMVAAGILPPAYVMERFARYFPAETPFSYILIRLHEISWTKSRFFLCDQNQQIAIADAINSVEGLTTTDRLIFCSAPIEPKRPGESELARVYAKLVADNRGVNITDIDELNFELLDDTFKPSRRYLAELERLHKGVIVWNWLSYRFTGVFMERDLSMHIKELVERRIEEVLLQLSFDYDKLRQTREQALLDMLKDEGQDNANLTSSEARPEMDMQGRAEEFQAAELEDAHHGGGSRILGINEVETRNKPHRRVEQHEANHEARNSTAL